MLGYFWPTGERGSGKTKWGMLWALMSYLGEFLLSSGSFAAIRDLANCGGAMVFDDAESLSDAKRCDPNKRELLLAGNRRGAQVPLKEPAAGGGWTIRWVNAYCPRAFTAIRTPDPTLASRTIAIPLVRTANAAKGNADPADTACWPCDHAKLLDDLWAAALELLPEAARVWTEFANETSATGREFEPWRAVLVVARLFERHGVDGLEQRMRKLMEGFRQERPDILGEDRTISVLRALLELADIKDISDLSDIENVALSVSAAKVASTLKEFAVDDDQLDAEWVTARSVGRILSRLRLRSEREANKNRDRRWTISKRDLAELARAYGLLRPTAPASNESQASRRHLQNPMSEMAITSETSEGGLKKPHRRAAILRASYDPDGEIEQAMKVERKLHDQTSRITVLESELIKIEEFRAALKHAADRDSSFEVCTLLEEMLDRGLLR